MRAYVRACVSAYLRTYLHICIHTFTHARMYIYKAHGVIRSNDMSCIISDHNIIYMCLPAETEVHVDNTTTNDVTGTTTASNDGRQSRKQLRYIFTLISLQFIMLIFVSAYYVNMKVAENRNVNKVQFMSYVSHCTHSVYAHAHARCRFAFNNRQ